MIPFADLPPTFLGQPVRWERASAQHVGLYQTSFRLGRLVVMVALDGRALVAKAQIPFFLRPGVTLFTFQGQGSVAEIDTATQRFLVDTTGILSEIALGFAPSMPAPTVALVSDN